MIPSAHAAKALAAILAVMFTAGTHADSWHSVQDASTLEFMVDYEGAEAPGRFRVFEVSVSVDPESMNPVALQVSVDTASARMGNPDIDEAIAEPEWLDSRSFPRAAFNSEVIREQENAEYTAEGVVSIKGVDQPLKVPFQWRTAGQEAEMTGSAILSRLDFGIGMGEWASGSPIGTRVEVRFKINLKPE